jgi:hypothetical protein
MVRWMSQECGANNNFDMIATAFQIFEKQLR